MDSPRTLPLEQATVQQVKLYGAERLPAGLGIVVGCAMIFSAIQGRYEALYGLPLVAFWHGVLVMAAVRDPQYFEILWRNMVTYRWPARLSAAAGVLAKKVKVELSVPVRG